MKRPSLFALVVLSLAVVLGCPSKPPEKGLAASAAGDNYCNEPKAGEWVVEIKVRYDPSVSPPQFIVGPINPECAYLKKSVGEKGNTIRWTVANEKVNGLPVKVTVDTFVNELNKLDYDPFGAAHGDNVFSVGVVAPGDRKDTLSSTPLKPEKTGTYKYRVTVDFIDGSKTTRIIVDPRLVVGD
jgi:hypothetical protein